MFSATMYYETPEGKAEKISFSSDKKEDVNLWAAAQMNELDFSYCILHNDTKIVRTA